MAVSAADKAKAKRYKQKMRAKGLCQRCTKPAGVLLDGRLSHYCPMCREICTAAATASRIRLKLEAFSHYGGLTCQCCQQSFDHRFLCLDHIAGNGADDRRTHGRGTPFARLKKQGWPSGFQVLCHNCNQAKKDRTECPHRELNEELLGKLAGLQLTY